MMCMHGREGMCPHCLGVATTSTAPAPKERAEAAAREEWSALSEAQRIVIRQGRWGETLRSVHKETARVLLERGLIWQPGLLRERGHYCVTGWGALVAFEPERIVEREHGPMVAAAVARPLQSTEARCGDT